MQVAYAHRNALISSVVHGSFQRAIKEIGLPEFPSLVFYQEISPYLQSSDSLFEEEDKPKLWRSILHGEIIAAEVWEDKHVFYVRGVVGTRVMDIRLMSDQHEWHIESIISMHSSPVSHSPLFRRTSFVAAVVLAAVVGYFLHRPSQVITSPASPPVAMQTNPNQSSSPATTDVSGQAGSPVHVGASSKAVHKGTSPAAGSATHHAKPSSPLTQPPVKPKPKSAQTITYTLTQGATLYDLAQFLYTHHLVKGAMEFDMQLANTGIDKDIHPGTFQFKTNMTESQIIEVLKQGPA